eukprot:CAMPEP_0174892342 /NCGR_PEP_ID=MMETSP0167-20121228/7306_1 /TAXON_ID=38298 /ORGANISM="Rhodella maculata, Strain CCMP736" /LENGTH=91 /DNA_ID=CAMNT_0016130803 /DNA_START=18 /DNA_END=290 /DNA_ORIENTATION=-
MISSHTPPDMATLPTPVGCGYGLKSSLSLRTVQGALSLGTPRPPGRHAIKHSLPAAHVARTSNPRLHATSPARRAPSLHAAPRACTPRPAP